MDIRRIRRISATVAESQRFLLVMVVGGLATRCKRLRVFSFYRILRQKLVEAC